MEGKAECNANEKGQLVIPSGARRDKKVCVWRA
jgi:hypothetical protein